MWLQNLSKNCKKNWNQMKNLIFCWKKNRPFQTQNFGFAKFIFLHSLWNKCKNWETHTKHCCIPVSYRVFKVHYSVCPPRRVGSASTWSTIRSTISTTKNWHTILLLRFSFGAASEWSCFTNSSFKLFKTLCRSLFPNIQGPKAAPFCTCIVWPPVKIGGSYWRAWRWDSGIYVYIMLC